MLIYAKVLADSVNPVGCRLTTWELHYPRSIHAELMTHRMLSKNSASSRAIPNAKLIERILNEPFMPLEWGSNQKGMQAGAAIDMESSRKADEIWLHARDLMIETAKQLADLGVHKQLVNRVLEPWMYITVICSGTELANLYHLRYNRDAEPHFQALAKAMYESQQASTPRQLQVGDWHLPMWDHKADLPEALRLHLETGEEMGDSIACKVAVGRIARVSYLTHDGRRDLREDIALHDRLVKSGHWSPFEHVAQALPNDAWSGNFKGFHQYRKSFQGENVTVFNGPAAQAA